jgi:hypothetical protein
MRQCSALHHCKSAASAGRLKITVYLTMLYDPILIAELGAARAAFVLCTYVDMCGATLQLSYLRLSAVNSSS